VIGRVLPIAAAGCVVGLDAATKRWAESGLSEGDAWSLAGEVARLRLGYNPGIAFGFLPQAGAVWLLPAGALVVAVAVWFVRELLAPAPMAAVWPPALILGGGLANLLDRWGDGRVTDFVDVGFGGARWPAFNLADAAICLGVAWLVLAAVREPGPRGNPAAAAPATTGRSARGVRGP
jgi:signal peptidase II